MRSALQQSELLRSTANAIKQDGFDVRFVRQPEWESDGAGGRRRAAGAPVTLAPQRVFKAGANRVSTPVGTDEGVRREHEFIVIGMPRDAYGCRKLNIQVGDTFHFNGDRYTVDSIHHDTTYQLKALCKVVSS